MRKKERKKERKKVLTLQRSSWCILELRPTGQYSELDVTTVLFQTIQVSISTQFSSIWPIDRTLSGATTLRSLNVKTVQFQTIQFSISTV